MHHFVEISLGIHAICERARASEESPLLLNPLFMGFHASRNSNWSFIMLTKSSCNQYY